MRGELLVPEPLPKVPVGRRAAASAIDFVAVSLLSLLLAGAWYFPFFLIFWLGMRVIWVAKNHGQSLGRWALDMRVVNQHYGSVPPLMDLIVREAITGLGAALALTGLVNLSPTNGLLLVLPVPLLVDCGLALLDAQRQQAGHDRLARTLVVESRRGYALDLKLKNLFAQVQRRVK